MKYKRIFLIVCDSLGCGYDDTSILYDDFGANTINHIIEKENGINIPTMEKLGYSKIDTINGLNKDILTIGSYGKAKEASVGKDTLTGHWEMMGIKTTTPFKTFTETGFPAELIELIQKKAKCEFIGNYASSGTEILKVLGEQSIKTGKAIIYTSSDSVLQIAAHEKYFGLERLYEVCKIAREICMDPKYMVGRIIARPFIGENKDEFVRTPNRHDYALSPSSKTVLNYLSENNYSVISVGKINDIFNKEGITRAIKSVSNNDGMEKNLELLKEDFCGLCFTNLVDFDAKYGHRRDSYGYKKAIEDFDKYLALMIKNIKEDDLIIITADHGNDPTWHGTDHTREYVPIIAYSKNNISNNLGTRNSFADIGATISENFNVKSPEIGKSFLKEI